MVILTEIEHPIKVEFKGAIVGEYEAGLLEDEKVIGELKVAKEYNPKDEPQLLNELKVTTIRVGLLINFGKEKVEFKRFHLLNRISVSSVFTPVDRNV